MDKTIESHSLNMKENFRQSNNNLEEIRNKISTDKKISDDLWETLLIKMTKKYTKVKHKKNKVEEDFRDWEVIEKEEEHEGST